jgi:alpha-L-fucosidase
MFDTRTTDYKIMNTPFGRDVTKEFVEACRNQGLAVGFYYSPEDFYFLYKKGRPVSRRQEESLMSSNPDLIEYSREQMSELMKNYGTIDIVFLDGGDGIGRNSVAKVCWEINPDVVVSRGAFTTPEQKRPNEPIPSPWEACITLGDQWQFRPTNENYKSCYDVIETLVDIRAKGGNLLLNLGPDADGEIPEEQAAIMNELSLWMFINKEAFEGTVPCSEYRDGDLWLLQSSDGNDLYAIYLHPDQERWVRGDWKEFLLKDYSMTANSKISVLGHAGEIYEYSPELDCSPRMKNTEGGLKLNVMRAQRIYNDRKWPNPIVIKLESLKKRESWL